VLAILLTYQISRLIAVEIFHIDVEQDQRKPPPRELLEGFGAASRSNHGGRSRFEDGRDRCEGIGVVVDDEDGWRLGP